jgi:hypothetical protein
MRLFAAAFPGSSPGGVRFTVQLRRSLMMQMKHVTCIWRYLSALSHAKCRGSVVITLSYTEGPVFEF